MCHLNLHRTAALHFGVKQIGEPYFRTMHPRTWGDCTRLRNCGVKHVRVGGTMYEPRELCLSMSAGSSRRIRIFVFKAHMLTRPPVYMRLAKNAFPLPVTAHATSLLAYVGPARRLQFSRRTVTKDLREMETSGHLICSAQGLTSHSCRRHAIPTATTAGKLQPPSETRPKPKLGKLNHATPRVTGRRLLSSSPDTHDTPEKRHTCNQQGEWERE